MLSGEHILCFAPDPWDDIWRNRHQIMSLLAESNQVIYVEPRPYLRSVLHRVFRGQISLAELRAPRIRSVRPGLHVFHQPLYAPLSGRAPLSTLTEAIRTHSLSHVMRRLGMSRPILWLFRPEMADVPGHYGERIVVYHIVDEYSGYADVDPAHAKDIRKRERALMARANLVLVTSRTLLESKKGINPNTFWVPNGVDYERFATAAQEHAEPVEVASLPHPRIGYVGAINEKIDTDLLERVAEAFPQAALVLVGPERVVSGEMHRGIEALRAKPNVHFVGQVGVERVPDLMAACDLGLLPYRIRDNAWTRNIQPLKMYEYLACGLPVVATDIPAVHDEAAVIQIAYDTDRFIAAVDEALRNDTPAARVARQARAADNTWRERVERISTLIEETLQRAP